MNEAMTRTPKAFPRGEGGTASAVTDEERRNLTNGMHAKRVALAICCALLILLTLIPVSAQAHEIPDLSRTGAITITMKYQGTAVPGGTLALYRVGQVAEDDGNYSFTPTEEFASCVSSFDDLTSASLAAKLADCAAEKTPMATKTANANGRVTFEDLPLGLYLIVQTEAAEDYEKIAPFLVTVPQYVDGTYQYQVDATSKMETITPKPEETTTPTTPPDDKLPQTGQLNWPIPLLITAGLLLLTLGYFLKFGKKKQEQN